MKVGDLVKWNGELSTSDYGMICIITRLGESHPDADQRAEVLFSDEWMGWVNTSMLETVSGG